MKEENTYKRRQGMSIVFSVILHLVLLALVIAASAMPVKEKDKIMKVRLASVKKPEPPPVQEVKPTEPPKQEVKKPDPQKPSEPPKQEAKKPDPQKPPEPPKQEVKPPEPQKTDPPNPKPEVKPLPQPKPVVKNPPKEQPKPQTPKPQTPKQQTPKPQTPKPQTPKQQTPKQQTPKQQTSKPQSIEERLAAGRQQQPVQQTTQRPSVGKEVGRKLRESLDQPQQTTSAPSRSTSAEMAAIEAESRSYAEEVVNHYIQLNWRAPSRGELDVRNPTGVEVSFRVNASGHVTSAKISKMSNSRVLNDSVQEFLRNMTQLPPLSTIGSKSAYLTIYVTMNMTN